MTQPELPEGVERYNPTTEWRQGPGGFEEVAEMDFDTKGQWLSFSDLAKLRAHYRQEMREGLDLESACYVFEAALQRHAATAEGYCPNRGVCDESCDCIVCRTQTLITEWEDHLDSLSQPAQGGEK